MARKKKHKKHRRSRRISGTSGFDFMSPLLALGGGVATKLMDHVIPDTVEGKTSAMIKVAIGAALPMFAKDPKTKKTLQDVGNGIVAVAGVQLLTEMEILSADVLADDDDMEFAVEIPDRSRQISGHDDDDDEEWEEMNEDVLGDDDDLPTINDGDDLPVVNGYDDEDDDY